MPPAPPNIGLAITASVPGVVPGYDASAKSDLALVGLKHKSTIWEAINKVD